MYAQAQTKRLFLELSRYFSADFADGSKVSAEKLDDTRPAQVLHASSVNDFKNKLDTHWSNQEMVHNYRV